MHLFWKEGPENWTTGELILYTFLYTMFLSATVFVTVGALARSEIKRLKKDLKEKDKVASSSTLSAHASGKHPWGKFPSDAHRGLTQTIALKDQKLDMCVEAMKKVHVPMPMDKLVGKKLVGFSEAAHSPGVLIASARRVIS